MLVGGGARDLIGAATSAAVSGARFTKSFLNSAHALDVLPCCTKGHSNARKRTATHSTAEVRPRQRQADACQLASHKAALAA